MKNISRVKGTSQVCKNNRIVSKMTYSQAKTMLGYCAPNEDYLDSPTSRLCVAFSLNWESHQK